MLLKRLGFIFLFSLLITQSAWSREEIKIPGEQLKLGVVAMQTSTAQPEAEKHFLLGLKYLHNFMYPLALREFKLAQKIDPAFAMAYWGMAMCYKWSLWSYENKRSGEAVLKQFNALKNVKMSPMEKGFLSAIQLIYQPGSILENEKKYLQAMKKLDEEYPQNPEVASFYALALIGYATDASFDKNAANFLQEARTVLEPFIKTHPSHPGVIHYYTHANDIANTEFPQKALVVVPLIYRYLSDSSHVLHMPSHLYTELGEWQESAHANEMSIAAGHKMCGFMQKARIPLVAVDAFNAADALTKEAKWTEKEKYACDADNIYHSLEWLHYDDLMLGQFNKAAAVLAEMKEVAEIEHEPMYDFWLYRMQARQMLYTKQFEKISSLPLPLVEKSQDKNWAAYSECGLLLAEGISAAHYQQENVLDAIDARLQKIISLLISPPAASFKKACLMNQAELRAAKAIWMEKDNAKGRKMLDEALKIQYELQAKPQAFTLPYVPVQELYGEFLLVSKDRKDMQKAAELYQNELKYFPGRTPAVKGLQSLSAIQ